MELQNLAATTRQLNQLFCDGPYVLFFLHLETRRGSVTGITRHPDQEWMEHIARSATQRAA